MPFLTSSNKAKDFKTGNKNRKNYRGLEIIPGHSLTRPSSFASQLMPWQSGKRGKSDNLNPQAK
jgi:hypothetical protein